VNWPESGSRPGQPGPLPLTPGQRGLWFLHALEPADTAYNTCTAIEIAGPLRLAALRVSIARIGARHDTLRTVFADADADAEPGQVFAAEPPPVRLADLGALPATLRDAAARQQLSRLAALPFDLRGGPPVRWLLLRYGPQRHVLVLDAHHIVFDRESLGVVCGELASCYTAAVAGRPGPRRPAGECGSDALRVAAGWNPAGQPLDGTGFWTSSLAGVPPDSGLFAGHPVPAAGPAAAGSDGTGSDGTGSDGTGPVRETVHVDHDQLGELARLCRAENATTFIAVLSLVAILIGRCTGQRDMVIGAPVSLRGTGQAGAVGLMINTLPLRVRVSSRSSLRSVLRQARDTVLGALEHRHVPLHRIVEGMGASRGAGASPLFQVLIAYQQQAQPPVLPGLRCSAAPVASAAAKYELTVTVTQAPAGLDVELEGDRRRCLPEDLRQWGRHLTALMRAAGADPDQPLGAIDLMDARERADALRQALGRRVRRDSAASAHGLVVERALAQPDVIAATEAATGGTRSQLSYGALHRSARQLARALRSAGAVPDQPVGVLQRRGLGVPVSYLAVLMAGGAVLPLDPDDPDERLAALLAGSGATVVVTHRPLAGRLGRLGTRTLAVEDFLIPGRGQRQPAPGARRGGQADRARPAGRVHPEQAAYLLYTSGSTGQPKGVLVPHRGLVNRLLWMRETLPLQQGDRILAKTPLSFDVSMAELLWPLTAGGTLCLADPGGERDPQYLAALVAREQLVFSHFVPSMLAPFAAELEASRMRLPTLRTVVCSGEPLTAGLSHRAAALLDGDLYNLYGPTEASIDVTAWRHDPAHRGPVPVGMPIANTECRVLDERLRPLPGLAVGELYLGGRCLARGYLGKPGLTAAAFLPAPSASPGSRLYRTGDLARRSPGGLIHVLGRRDHQVKIAGRRIEPGEVAAALRQQPGVTDAAVVACDGRLAAFIVAGPALAAGPWRETLAGALRALLPGYLVPATIEALDRLPVTAAGKTDLRALRERAASAPPGPQPGGVPPRSDLERQLAAAWCSVLPVRQVGVHDRFFDLGGNSLTLLRLHRRLADTVAPGLTVRDLFRFPTVAALSGFLAEPGPGTAMSPGARQAVARAARRRAAAGAARPAHGPAAGVVVP
jgi:amino acid adenylation domain-containing protein